MSDDRKFITITYRPSERPQLHAFIQSLPKRERSRELCDRLDPAISPVPQDHRLDRVLKIAEAMAFQNDRIESAVMNLITNLAQGTPMQTVVEQVENDDLPDDVLGNLMDLGG